MIEYDLEKELIENDPELKNLLSQTKDIADRVFFKYFYSNKINNYEKQGLPADVPSIKLKKIIDDLIEGEIPLKNLSISIQENLKIYPEIAKKIAEKIEKNKEIIDEINAIKPTEESNTNIENGSQKESEKPTKSIGYELLK